MSQGFQCLQRTLVKLAVLISIQRLGFGEGKVEGYKGNAESMHNYQWRKNSSQPCQLAESRPMAIHILLTAVV